MATGFRLPGDLQFNTEPIADPADYAATSGGASWLYLNGPEFDDMDGGMSFDDVTAAVATARNVISDPPRELDLVLAREHVNALDELPRPTLVTCRAGPRASAVVYMYAGLRSGATAADVVDAAIRDDAPCSEFPDYLAWIARSITELAPEKRGSRAEPHPDP